MEESVSDLPPYQNPRIEETQVDSFPVVVAEISNIREGRTPRSHLRVLGGSGTGVAGHPLVYADRYTRDGGDETYSYARHNVDQMALLEGLEEFLARAIHVDFTELRKRPAFGAVQTDDGMEEFEYPSYLAAVDAMKSRPMLFARLNFPFGDITVEFQEQADVTGDEFRFLSEGVLSRSLERPLFAFDATKSDIWTRFLASIHWARDRVDPEVLRQVLRMATRVAA